MVDPFPLACLQLRHHLGRLPQRRLPRSPLTSQDRPHFSSGYVRCCSQRPLPEPFDRLTYVLDHLGQMARRRPVDDLDLVPVATTHSALSAKVQFLGLIPWP